MKDKTQKLLLSALVFCMSFGVVSTITISSSHAQSVSVNVNGTKPPDEWVQRILRGPLIPENCQRGAQQRPTPPLLYETCGLREALQVFGNITKLLLAIIGSVALLMFIFGGFTMILSAGNAERVQKGKNILVNAVIGIAIVFLSWVFINFVIIVLTQDSPNFREPGKIFEDQNINQSPSS